MMEVLMAASVCIGAISLIISTAVLVIIISNNYFKNNKNNNTPAPMAPQADDVENVKAKQRAKAEQDAFEELLGYSIDTAYGIKHEE